MIDMSVASFCSYWMNEAFGTKSKDPLFVKKLKEDPVVKQRLTEIFGTGWDKDESLKKRLKEVLTHWSSDPSFVERLKQLLGADWSPDPSIVQRLKVVLRADWSTGRPFPMYEDTPEFHSSFVPAEKKVSDWFIPLMQVAVLRMDRDWLAPFLLTIVCFSLDA